MTAADAKLPPLQAKDKEMGAGAGALSFVKTYVTTFLPWSFSGGADLSWSPLHGNLGQLDTYGKHYISTSSSRACFGSNLI